MPPNLEDRTEVIDYLVREEGHDRETAETIAEALQSEASTENGDVEELWDALRDATGMIVDAAIELNSAVDIPAIESKWVMFKSPRPTKGHNRCVETQLVFKQGGENGPEKRIAYAPAMIPRQPDKEGEVVPTSVVENSAHGYLKEGGGVDTDHKLIEGKGDVVESWIEPEARTWDLPDGGSETYPPGTWMLGVEWTPEAWERIQEGELTGLSIYGMAEQLPLSDPDLTARSILKSYSELAKSVPSDLEEQFPEEWPFSADEDGIEECKERMAGEVDDPEAFCFAWASEAGVRDLSTEGSETGRTSNTEPSEPDERVKRMSSPNTENEESPTGDDGNGPPVTRDEFETLKAGFSEHKKETEEKDRDIDSLLDSAVRELADHDDVTASAADLREKLRSFIFNEDDDDEDDDDEDMESSFTVENSTEVERDAFVEWATDHFEADSDAIGKAFDDELATDDEALDVGAVHRFVDAFADSVTATDTAAVLSAVSGSDPVERSVDSAQWRRSFDGEEHVRSTTVDERQQPTSGGLPSRQAAVEAEEQDR